MRRTIPPSDWSPRSLRRVKALFGGVVLYLLAGLVLRAVGSEPYPAVLLPAGGGVLERTEDAVRFDRLEIVACDRDRACFDVSVHDLLAGFPGSVRPYIVENRFGVLQRAPRQDTRLAVDLPHRFMPPSAGDTDDVRATKQWLKDRLGVLTHREIAQLRIVRRHYAVRLPNVHDRHLIAEELEAVITW